MKKFLNNLQLSNDVGLKQRGTPVSQGTKPNH